MAGTVIAVAIVLLGTAPSGNAADPDALWKIVHQQCIPDQQQQGDPAPCALVDLQQGDAKGYAVLKDIVGATQYLLIPTARVSGIESPLLLDPAAPNYFADAWLERGYTERAAQRPLPREAISLAINSAFGRSQDQLHIHIDCVRADVRGTLAKLRSSIGDTWAPLSEPVGSHPYWAMRVVGPTLGGHNPFKLLADGIPKARDNMKMRTLVVVGMQFDANTPGFVLLADRVNPLIFDFGAGARLEDHACGAGAGH